MPSSPLPDEMSDRAFEVCLCAALDSQTPHDLSAVKTLFARRSAQGLGNPLQGLEITVEHLREAGVWPEDLMYQFILEGANPLASTSICSAQHFKQDSGLMLFLASALAEAEDQGHPSRDDQGNCYLHHLAEKAPVILVQLEKNLAGHAWLGTANAQGDTPAHSLWREVLRQLEHEEDDQPRAWKNPRELRSERNLLWDATWYLWHLGANMGQESADGQTPASLATQAIAQGLSGPVHRADLTAELQAHALKGNSPRHLGRGGARL